MCYLFSFSGRERNIKKLAKLRLAEAHTHFGVGEFNASEWHTTESRRPRFFFFLLRWIRRKKKSDRPDENMKQITFAGSGIPN